MSSPETLPKIFEPLTGRLLTPEEIALILAGIELPKEAT